jgi:hypothetical protein
MLPWLMRATTFSAIVIVLAVSTGCADQSRCAAALDRYEHLQDEIARRDLRIQSLEQMHMALLFRLGPRDVDGRDALAKKLALLEADNQELAARARHAQEALDVERQQRILLANSPRRPLDEAIPYGAREPDIFDDLIAFDPRKEARREHPRRVIDEAVPYEPTSPRPPSQIYRRVSDPARASASNALRPSTVGPARRSAARTEILIPSPASEQQPRRSLDESMPYR